MNIQTRKTKENTMNSQAQPYQPLTSENAAAVLVDHQVGLMTGVRDYSTGELKHNVVALAKAAKALKLPIVVTTTARDSMWGPTFPELVEALPGIEIIDRSSVNAYDGCRPSRGTRRTQPLLAAALVVGAPVPIWAQSHPTLAQSSQVTNADGPQGTAGGSGMPGLST